MRLGVYREYDFGLGSTYTYSELANLLGHYGEVGVHRAGPIDDQILSGRRVLILKTPTVAVVLGDHNNLMGMNTYLNEVVGPLGLVFRSDDVFDYRSGGFVDWRKNVFDQSVVQFGMPPRMRMETSCSIEASFRGQPLMLTRDSASEPSDWSNPGFFGDLKFQPSDVLAPAAVAATVGCGKGRVVAFADSTVFSGFSLFFPGRREAILALINVAARGTVPWIRAVCLAGGFVLLLALWWGQRITAIDLSVGILIASLFTLTVVALIGHRTSQIPKPV